MSHRGGANEHLENTLPAFKHSVQVGVDMLELDCHLTKDKQVVVFHDDTLGRLCGPAFKSKRISDFRLDELPPLLIPSHMDSAVESARIPLLLDVFEACPDYPMQIDVKSGPQELIELVGNMIIQHKREHLTVWGSFRAWQNNTIVALFGTRIPMFFSLVRALKARILFSIGLMQWMNIYESALIMPDWDLFLNRKWIESLNERGVSVIVFGGSSICRAPNNTSFFRRD